MNAVPRKDRRWPLLMLALIAVLCVAGIAVSFAHANGAAVSDPAGSPLRAERASVAPERTPAAPREPRHSLAEARETADALGRPLTVVSLTFDDGTANQWSAVQTMDALGLQGTFYVPTGRIDGAGALDYEQLVEMQAGGHEIGGHTVGHVDLTTVGADEAARQICDDRARLLDWGFDARSFAYPFARSTPELQQQVIDCGYSSGRMLGALRSPEGCDGCATVEDLEPAEPSRLRAPAQITGDWQIDDLQSLVVEAEQSGGWMPITFHNVCESGCEINITPQLFAEFAGWLSERRSTHGTVVLPVGDVLGGAALPAVVGPEAAPTTAERNAVRNPSLDADAAGVPDCWMPAGYGDNAAEHDTVTPGRSGATAARVRIDDHRDGDAKWLPRFDLGECSPSVASGATYDLRSWYASSGSVQFAVYLRNELGGWQYWTSSSWFPAAEQYRQAVWTTPAVPEGYDGISFGLALLSDGELVVDDAALLLDRPPGAGGSSERVEVESPVEMQGETEAERVERSSQ